MTAKNMRQSNHYQNFTINYLKKQPVRYFKIKTC